MKQSETKIDSVLEQGIYLWNLCKCSIKLQFPINYLIRSHFNLRSWELVLRLLAFSIWLSFRTSVRSARLADGRWKLLAVVFRENDMRFMPKMCSVLSSTKPRGRDWNTVKLAGSIPGCVKLFIASAGDFREKIFSEWINIYLSLFGVRETFFCWCRSFFLSCFFLMWKQIFNQEFFICGPLLSFCFISLFASIYCTECKRFSAKSSNWPKGFNFFWLHNLFRPRGAFKSLGEMVWKINIFALLAVAVANHEIYWSRRFLFLPWRHFCIKLWKLVFLNHPEKKTTAAKSDKTLLYENIEHSVRVTDQERKIFWWRNLLSGLVFGWLKMSRSDMSKSNKDRALHLTLIKQTKIN